MAIKTAIVGASGYTGAELLRILATHPEFEVAIATGESQAGKTVTELYPHLSAYRGLMLRTVEEVKPELPGCDLIFCGLPHGEAMSILPSLSSRVIVDLGSDFRLQDTALYDQWYKVSHTAPQELPKWVYGLPELFREQIKGHTRIANPGCYATASALGAAPLLKAGLIGERLVINAASGTSGAGRPPKPNLHFSHTYEDVRAYKVAEHQHTPEIEMSLSRFSARQVLVSFTPLLLPMSRGIISTISAPLTEGVTAAKLLEALSACYEGEPFIQVVREQPGTKEVRGSNQVMMTARTDSRLGLAVVTVVIDNLVKGAAGQAIQNANIALGLPETAGLLQQPLYP